MFGLFKSLEGLAFDVLKVATAPIEIAANLADAMVKPLAEGLSALADEVKPK